MRGRCTKTGGVRKGVETPAFSEDDIVHRLGDVDGEFKTPRSGKMAKPHLRGVTHFEVNGVGVPKQSVGVGPG